MDNEHKQAVLTLMIRAYQIGHIDGREVEYDTGYAAMQDTRTGEFKNLIDRVFHSIDNTSEIGANHEK